MAFLSAISFPGIPVCPGIQQSSTIFPYFCRLVMVCLSFCTFGVVGICFSSACRQILEPVNIVKLFLFVADIVFKARCIACVSAMNIELNFDSDA